ncbi:hypothetical protein BDZ97DRAFT_1671708 [Flammula alnicola]|nr:hypothetical protein BDZ97DRAFT_1671708 [Flammula alnicola]
MPRVEPQTKKTRRGKRNLKTAERLTEKWVESGGLDRVLKKIQSSTRTTNIPQYPDQFLCIRGREQVADTLARVFPSLMLDQLKLEPQDGRLMYPTPSCDGLKSLHSPYLAARFHDVLKRPEQTALIAAWDALNTLDVRYPKPELQHSKVPALHVGIWENYHLLPIISSDAQDQAPDVIIAMDIFLSLIGKFIAPRLGNLLYRYFPQQYSRQERCVEISFSCRDCRLIIFCV